jgi:hypothetical protein
VPDRSLQEKIGEKFGLKTVWLWGNWVLWAEA